MSLGEYLNQYLNEQNMSMREFAKKAGVSHTYITYLINGRTQRGTPLKPTFDKFKAIANAMGMDSDTLAGIVDDDIAWSARENEYQEYYEELQVLRDMPETRTVLKNMKGMTADQVKAMSAFIKSLKGNSDAD